MRPTSPICNGCTRSSTRVKKSSRSSCPKSNGQREANHCGGFPRWGKHEGLSREVVVRGDGLHCVSLSLVPCRDYAVGPSRTAPLVSGDFGDQSKSRWHSCESI